MIHADIITTDTMIVGAVVTLVGVVGWFLRRMATNSDAQTRAMHNMSVDVAVMRERMEHVGSSVDVQWKVVSELRDQLRDYGERLTRCEAMK